jgi:hydroxycarboxylate dehydrogenase B
MSPKRRKTKNSAAAKTKKSALKLQPTILVPHEELRAYTMAILRHIGSTAKEAQIVADHLVDANLTGHDSHGVGMMPRYIQNFRNGFVTPNRHAKPVRRDGAFLQFDGQQGFGQVVAQEATDKGIAKAKKSGLALVSLGNAHHIGRVGTYGERAVAQGLVSLSFVNVLGHKPTVAPYGGSDGRFITNPICFAIPGTDGLPPFVLDMATSVIALGKVRVAMNEGRLLPEGKLIDHRGKPTRDPRVMFSEPLGALLPLGEHKGYGLAYTCEILAGILSATGSIQPKTPRTGGIINNMLSVIFDPVRLVDRNWFHGELKALAKHVKASRPSDPKSPVLMPGDPERATMAQRRRDGVPVDRTTWTEIRNAGLSVGMTAKQLARWNT